METALMNIYTGSVDTEDNWRMDAEIGCWDFDEECEALVEVAKDDNGKWVEVM